MLRHWGLLGLLKLLIVAIFAAETEYSSRVAFPRYSCGTKSFPLCTQSLFCSLISSADNQRHFFPALLFISTRGAKLRKHNARYCFQQLNQLYNLLTATAEKYSVSGGWDCRYVANLQLHCADKFFPVFPLITFCLLSTADWFWGGLPLGQQFNCQILILTNWGVPSLSRDYLQQQDCLLPYWTHFVLFGMNFS